MQDVQTFTQSIEGFEVDGIKIDKLYLNFHNYDYTEVEAIGDLSEYEILWGKNGMNIKTAKERRIVKPVNNNAPCIDSLTITVPNTFAGFFEFNGVGCDIIIKPEVLHKLHKVSLNGVDIALHMERIDTLLEISGVSTNVLLSEFSGKIDCSGVSTKTIIHGIVSDTTIDISGMSSALVIHEEGTKNHYDVTLSGISSKLTYYGERRSSFGAVQFKTHHNENNPVVKIDGNGVNTKVNITA